MKQSVVMTWVVLFVNSVLVGCNSTTPNQPTPTPPEVTVAKPLELEITDFDDYEGRVASPKVVELRSRVTGYLKDKLFQEGTEVEENQPLFLIDERTFAADFNEAKANSATVKARVQRLTADLARADRLRNTPGALPREEYDKILGDLAEAKSQVTASEEAVKKAQLYLEFTKIDSPIKGKIGPAKITKGNLVTADQTVLATIVSTDPMYAEFDVDEPALLRYKKNYKRQENGEPSGSLKDRKIPMHVRLQGEAGYPHRGLLYDASNRLNQSTGTIRVRGELDNPMGLLEDGMRAVVRVPVSDPYKAVLIPEEAVGTDQQRKFVYVVDNKNTAKRVPVKLGEVREGLVIVEEGVSASDRVIIEGIQFVRPDSPVKTKEIALEVPPNLQNAPEPAPEPTEPNSN